MKKPFCDICGNYAPEAAWPVYSCDKLKDRPNRKIIFSVDLREIEKLNLDFCQSCITGVLLSLVNLSKKRHAEIEKKEWRK